MNISVKEESIQYIKTPHGVAYSAQLFCDNELIGMIHNAGNGGDTSLTEMLSNDGKYSGKIKKEADKAFPNEAEPVSQYLESLMDKAEEKTITLIEIKRLQDIQKTNPFGSKEREGVEEALTELFKKMDSLS